MCGGSPPSVPLANRPDDQLQQIVELANHSGPGLNFLDPKTRDPWLLLRVQQARGQQAEAQQILGQRAEFKRIGQERTALAEQQQAEMQRLQQAQAQAAINQQQQVEQLQAEEAQQRQVLAQGRLATNAATASMRVLQGQGSTTKAPTAAVSRGPRAVPTRRGGAASSLRIGGTAAASGVGLNIGG